MLQRFANPAVQNVFNGFPATARAGLLQLRELIFDVAVELPDIGGLHEELRWGQPAYLTGKRAGSTIRLGVPKKAAFGLFAHCQTTIISDFAAAFPDVDRIEGNRAVLFDDPSQIDPARHGMLIRAALTYHL